MLACTAWTQACRSFSESACSMQLLGGGARQAERRAPPPPPPGAAPPHLVGDTTSKQNLRSMSSHGFTEHRRRSSTTTVSTSCRRHTRPSHWRPALPTHRRLRLGDTDRLSPKCSLSRQCPQSYVNPADQPSPGPGGEPCSAPSASSGRPAGCSGWRTSAWAGGWARMGSGRAGARPPHCPRGKAPPHRFHVLKALLALLKR